MSVCLNLRILPENINENEWKKIYDQTLLLFKSNNDILMGIKDKIFYSTKRLFYCKQLEHNKESPENKFWIVNGDYKSKKFSQGFKLYRNINKYKKNDDNLNNSDNSNNSDILISLIAEESQNKHTHNPVVVFDNISRGYPYHIYILAAGMLFEDKFKQYAFVSGNIDLVQAQQAQELINNVLNKQVSLPICVNAPKLFKRIKKNLNEKDAIVNSYKIFRGESNNWFKSVYNLCDKQFFNKWFLNELKLSEFPDYPDTIDMYMEWLNTTGDLKKLCYMACIDKNGPLFNQFSFVKALASTWIGIDETKFDFLNIFQEDIIQDEDFGFGMMFMNIDGFMGKKLRFHMNIEDICKIFKELFKQDYDDIQKAFIKGTQDAEKQLIRLNDPIKDLLEANNDEPDIFSSENYFMDIDDINKASQKHIMMIKAVAQAIKHLLNKFLERKPELIDKDCDSLLSTLTELSTEYSPIFTEYAWKWIDKENKNMLQMLIILMAMNREGRQFWNLRKAVFENQNLAKSVLDMVTNSK